MYSHKKSINPQAKVMVSKEINNHMGKPNIELTKINIMINCGNSKSTMELIITWQTEEEFIGIQAS